MTQPRQSNSPAAEKVAGYVRQSIANRGGTGRRLSKIQMNTGLEDDEFRAAVRELVATGDWTVDEQESIGFVYLCPVKAE